MPEETNPQSSAPQPEDHPLTPPNDQKEHEQIDPAHEKDLWEGRQSWKSLYPTAGLWLFLTIIIIVGTAILSKSGMTTLWVAAGCLVVMAIMVLRGAIRVWRTSYRITTQRLFIRRGILTQTVDQTELLRVDDVKMQQTILDRMLGIGTVEVMSNDRTDTNICLKSIDNPAVVQEHIRRHTRMVQGKRTLFMEQL